MKPSSPIPMDALRSAFGEALQENASLAAYTTARTGGPADALLIASSAQELEDYARRLWEMEVPFTVLGYGSNVLISDQGLRRIVIINRARAPPASARRSATSGSISRTKRLMASLPVSAGISAAVSPSASSRASSTWSR